MIPVYQTRFHGEGQAGNCFPACIASLLEIGIEEVPWPEWQENDDWSEYWRRLARWLAGRGLYLIEWETADVVPWMSDLCADAEALWIAGGPGPRGVRHCVVMRGADVAHDPHHEGGGISSVETVTILAALDPAAQGRGEGKP